jgi:hypothetical protein
MVLKLSRDDVAWPGSAHAVRDWLARLQAEWRMALENVTNEDLQSTERTRWPFQNRSLGRQCAVSLRPARFSDEAFDTRCDVRRCQ